MIENKSQKNRTVAFLLAFFLGGIGAHRFYIKKPGTAIVMLLMAMSFILIPISIIWGLVDAVRIAVGNLKDGDSKPIINW